MTPRTTTLTAALVVSFSTVATIFACAGRAESDQTAIEPEAETEAETGAEQGSLATRCPEALPEDGSSCERYPTGLVCEYEFCDGLGRSASCAPVILSRDEGRWSTNGPSMSRSVFPSPSSPRAARRACPPQVRIVRARA